MFKSSSHIPSSHGADAGSPESITDKDPPEGAADQTVDITPDMVIPLPEVDTSGNAEPLALFGRYQARKILGSGGYGTVYLGYDQQLTRAVAIKVLKAGAQASQSKIDEFLEEARRLAQLHHPGIVAVHDVAVESGQVYIVSEFLSGSNLGDWLVRNRLSWREASSWRRLHSGGTFC